MCEARPGLDAQVLIDSGPKIVMVKTNSNCFFLQPPRLVSTKQYLNFRRIEFNPHYYEHLDKSNDLFCTTTILLTAVQSLQYFILFV